MDWLVAFGCGVKDLLSSEAFRGLVIFAGVIVAIVSVLTSRVLAKKKQAADMLFGSRGDEKLQRGCKVVKRLHDEPGKNLRTLLNDPDHQGEISDILYVLNHFETVCVGLKNGIYDEAILKDAWCTIMVDTYDFSKPLVESMRARNKKDTAFQEYEHLVDRWKKYPLKRRTKW